MANGMELFPKLRKWAVIGVSADQSKYGNKIFRDLRDAGYEVYGVNPKLDLIEGDKCYNTLAELPVVPEVVNVVVPPQLARSKTLFYQHQMSLEPKQLRLHYCPMHLE